MAAICHEPVILIKPGFAGGRVLTSYPPVRIDPEKPCADGINLETLLDRNLLASRLGDLPVSIREMIKLFAEQISKPR
jgi:putative intracellular protease/amidase